MRKAYQLPQKVPSPTKTVIEEVPDEEDGSVQQFGRHTGYILVDDSDSDEDDEPNLDMFDATQRGSEEIRDGHRRMPPTLVEALAALEDLQAKIHGESRGQCGGYTHSPYF